MRFFTVIASLFLLSAYAWAQPHYDVVIVGGTPGGITCAISAAREGMSVAILERTNHIGGLPANGLGATDISTRGATTGLFLEFVNRNLQYYQETYGADSQQVKDCSEGYHFEPSVAERSFLGMLDEYPSITVLYSRQFDCLPDNVTKEGETILGIKVLNKDNSAIEEYAGGVFIDATYEGDLAAAAGVPYHIGRESATEYGEPCAGRIFRHWGVQFVGGGESEGSSYMGDNAVQAYNYRLCLTSDEANMTKIKKPTKYNREDYVSLIDDVWTGRNTGIETAKLTEADYQANREALKAGKRTLIPGDPWGIAKITNMVRLPNAKTDANNQHMAFISTDLPEETGLGQAPVGSGETSLPRGSRNIRLVSSGLFRTTRHFLDNSGKNAENGVSPLQSTWTITTFHVRFMCVKADAWMVNTSSLLPMPLQWLQGKDRPYIVQA